MLLVQLWGKSQICMHQHDHYFLVPVAFRDLTGCGQMSIGLLSVTASVYQMLRGAEMLFAALFSVTILKR